MLSRHKKLLQTLTRVTHFFRSTELEWDCYTSKLSHCRNDAYQSAKYQRKVTIFTAVYAALVIQGMHKYFYAPENNNSQSKDNHKILYSFEVVMFIFGWMYLISTRCNLYATCAYVNGVTDFAEKYKQFGTKCKRNLSLMNKLNLSFAYATSPSCYVVPVLFFYGLYWKTPCKPSVVGYGLLPECWDWDKAGNGMKFLGEYTNTVNFGMKIGVLAVNQYAWSYGVSTMLFVVPVMMIMCTMSLREYLVL